MKETHRLATWAGRLAQLLVRAYPADFRRSLGRDLLATYARQGSLKRLQGAAAAIWDLAKNGVAIRWDALCSAWRGRSGPQPSPKRQSRPRRKIGEAMIQDFRFALRSLRRTPLHTAGAVLILALGIGANSAIFSIVSAIVLQPLPYSDPDRLALVWPEKTFNKRMLPYFQERLHSFEDLATASGWTMTLVGEGDPELLAGAQVSSNYFQVLGIKPAIGRGFRAEDSQPDQADVVVLSHGLWQRRFGSDPGVVGKRIRLSLGKRDTFTVIGVLPAGYRPLEGRGTWQVWVPLPMPENLDGDSSWYLMAVGRLKADVQRETAEAEVKEVASVLRRDIYPRIEEETVRVASVLPLSRAVIGETIRTRLWMLLGATGLILLIACANVGNLMLAKLASRRRELGVRRALGATAARLVGLIFAESLLLAAAGGVCGLLLYGLAVVFAADRLQGVVPDGHRLSLDFVVVGFSLAAGLVSALAFCLPPVWRVLRDRRPTDLAVRSQGSASADRSRLSAALVGAEIALAVILASGGVLLLQSFARLSLVQPGFSADRVLTLSISTPDSWELPRKAAFFEELVPRLRGLHDVQVAGSVQILPLAAGNWSFPYIPEGRSIGPHESMPLADFRVISPGYFRSMGIPLQRGRDFEPSDRTTSAAVGIVNQTMADRLWPDQDPLGKHIRIFNESGPEFEVVGVVGNIRQHGLQLPSQPEMYRPHQQWIIGSTFLTLRTTGDPMDAVAGVREVVRSMSDEVPLSDIRTMDAVLASSLSGNRTQAMLLGGFALLALLLAVVGVYGVTAYTEGRRRQEFGVRIALGARRGDLLRQALLRALPSILIGETLGLFAALGLARLISGLLYDIGADDAGTFVLVFLSTGLASLLACVAPASRAGRVDPVEALRCD